MSKKVGIGLIGIVILIVYYFLGCMYVSKLGITDNVILPVSGLEFTPNIFGMLGLISLTIFVVAIVMFIIDNIREYYWR